MHNTPDQKPSSIRAIDLAGPERTTEKMTLRVLKTGESLSHQEDLRAAASKFVEGKRGNFNYKLLTGADTIDVTISGTTEMIEEFKAKYAANIIPNAPGADA